MGNERGETKVDPEQRPHRDTHFAVPSGAGSIPKNQGIDWESILYSKESILFTIIWPK